MNLKKLLFILLLGVVVWSCQKDDDEEDINRPFNVEKDEIVS